MSDLKTVKQQLTDYLSDCFSVEGVTVVGEFPFSRKPSPLSRCRISVGFDAMEIEENLLDGYLGQEEDQILSGRCAALTLRFDIACPVPLGGSRCQEVFESLLEFLLLADNQFGVGQLSCGAVSYDKNIGGFLLTAHGRMTTLIRSGESAVSIDTIDLRRVME